MLIPFLTYPYLIRILGTETYGLVVFAQAVVGYFVILVGFGFPMTATKEVSINRNNKEKLSEIVSSVLIIKSILFIISLGILGALLQFIPQAKGYELIFYLSMWMCVYDIIFPGWYFQGIEQMKYVTVISITMRLIFLGLIFIFIKAPADYLYVPLLYGIGSLVAGTISLYIVFRIHKIRFYWQPYSNLKYFFKDSLPIFISNVSSNIYISTNKIVIGAFLGMEEVSFYDLAEKITSILKTPQGILVQSLFPKISKEKNLTFIKRIFKISIIINVGLFLILLFTSKDIVLILGGKAMLPSTIFVIIMAITVPLNTISTIFGVLLLIANGFNKIFSRIIVTAGFFYLAQILTLWFFFGFTILTVLVITIITELYVSISLFYKCKKLGLWK